MKQKIPLVPVAVAAICLGIPMAMANAPARFIDLDKPQVTRVIGTDVALKVFGGAADGGVRLHNTGAVEIRIQDTVSLSTLNLAPGMRLSLQCDSARHFALSTGSDVVYESVVCGSLLRFSSDNGGQR
ncbi:MAG TPA: hypothetical protein VF267_08630 [Gammaproteobacteria bacterium]